MAIGGDAHVNAYVVRARLRAAAVIALAPLLTLLWVSSASAAAALSVSPSTSLTNGQSVTVSASGLAANSAGGIIECNNATPQPTVAVLGNQVPVSCTNPLLALHPSDGSGNIPDTAFTVHTGVVGPPAAGTDSAGHASATDAADFPCPPTAAQIAAGASCVVAYGNLAGDQVTHTISFSSGGGTTTTTTTGGVTTTTGGVTTTTGNITTTTSGGTTTTTTSGGPSIVVTPHDGLHAGDALTVTGSGFTPGVPIGIVECSPLAATADPATATNECDVSKVVITNASGSGGFSSPVTALVTGASSPNDFAPTDTNAVCPPPSGGGSCLFAAANIANQAERGSQEISFAGEVVASSTSSTLASSTTGATVLGEQISRTGALAATGPRSPLVMWTLIGFVLVDVGYLIYSSTRPPLSVWRKARVGV